MNRRTGKRRFQKRHPRVKPSLQRARDRSRARRAAFRVTSVWTAFGEPAVVLYPPEGFVPGGTWFPRDALTLDELAQISR